MIEWHTPLRKVRKWHPKELLCFKMFQRQQKDKRWRWRDAATTWRHVSGVYNGPFVRQTLMERLHPTWRCPCCQEVPRGNRFTGPCL